MAQRLLLADDSVTIQRVIELTFADEDIEVTVVGDGQRAIQLISAERPDIVLADVDMPERNGFEVSAFIKRTPDLAHIPVILLTGAFEPVDDERVRAAGCEAVLAKPFEPQMLISRVKDLLASASCPRPAVPAAAPVPPVPSAAPKPADAAAPAVSEVAWREPQQALSLDEYFDQLDAAFGGPGVTDAKPAEPPAAAAASEWPGEVAGEWLPSARPVVVETPAAPAVTPPVQPAAAVAHPGPTAAVEPVSVAPPLASTFSVLLAAEQGEPVPAGMLPTPGQIPAVVMDQIVEKVAARVSEKLADQALREQVATIVSAVADRLVREEIARVKASIKTD